MSTSTPWFIRARLKTRQLLLLTAICDEGNIHRAAEVHLKERRKLVLVPRETPLNDVHLENMLALSRMGVVIFPPTPAWYNQPQSLDDAVDHLVGRMLDQFGLRSPRVKRWEGMRGGAKAPALPPEED